MSDRIKHSKPISIPANNNGGFHAHSRGARSASYSTSGSSDDESNSPPLQTPTSSVPPPRVGTAAQSPSTSPILSYFFQSPNKVAPTVIPQSPTGGFGSIGRGFSAKPQEQPIIEEDEDHEPAIVRHARRMSTSAGWAPAAPPRFNPVTPTEQTERGAGLLRRLSLGSALVRPQVSTPAQNNANPTGLAPPAAISAPKQPASPGRKKRRASTLGVPGEGTRPRRSPSPMGERILKGHFDGFN